MMLLLIVLQMCLCAVVCFFYCSCCDQGQMNEYQINCGILSQLVIKLCQLVVVDAIDHFGS